MGGGVMLRPFALSVLWQAKTKPTVSRGADLFLLVNS